MARRVVIIIDDVEVETEPGKTIIEAADAAGIYIPRLCYLPEIAAHGSCRICTVLANGRPSAACTAPVSDEMIVENESERIRALRRELLDMLFVEGNHLCMFCDASGRCELQALAYRFGITHPAHPYLYPVREIDGTHPEVLLDRGRCILCARCVSTSRQIDGKAALGFVGRSSDKLLTASSRHGLGGTSITRSDRAVTACPVGALIPKHRGYDVPIGRRAFDQRPIGSRIEARRDSEE